MLTGDKGRTAREIGFNCGLLKREEDILEIDETGDIRFQMREVCDKAKG